MLLAAVGNAIAAGTTVVGARFFAMFLMPMGAVSSCGFICATLPRSFTNFSPDQIIVSWVANSFPRPLVKRSAAIAICNMIGNTATIYGSYLYPSSDSPQYRPGGSANAAICVVVALLALVLRYIHKWENKKLQRAEGGQGTETGAGGKTNVGSSRQVPQPGFRYIY